MRGFVRFFNDRLDGHVVADVKSFGNQGCDLAYNLPDSFANGEFNSILAYVSEEATDCFIIGESTGRRECVVLHEYDCCMSDLRSEIPGLAFPETEILFAVLENYLNSPSHGINSVGLEEIQGCIGGKDTALGSAFAAAHIEHSYRNVVKECVDDDIVALDMARFDVPYNVLADKPAVSQQIVKPIAVCYGSAYHFFKQLDLAAGVVLHSRGRGAFPIALFAEAAAELSFAHRMVALLARLADNLEVYSHLAFAVADCQGQCLEAENHLVGHVAEYSADVFSMDSAFGIVGVVNYHTNRIARVIGAVANTSPKLASDMAHYLTPIQSVIVYEPIEKILRCAA